MNRIKTIIEKVKCCFAAVICRCVFHKLIITRKVSDNIQELKCLRCGREFAICHSEKAFLPLNEEIRKHNDMVSNGI